MEPFWPKEEDKSWSGANTCPFVAVARKLETALRGKRMIAKTPNLKKNWAPYFEKLAKEYKYEEINNTVDYYVSHINDEGFPKFCSAKSFCAGFNIVYTKYLQHGGVHLTADVDDVLIRMDNLSWPVNFKQKLPLIAQRSYNNYIPFFNKMVRIRASMLDFQAIGIKESGFSPKLLRLFKYIYESKVYNAKHFLEQWIFKVNKDIQWIKEFQGDVDKYIFSVRGERFTEQGQAWTQEYCGDWKLWEELINCVEKYK